MGKKIDVFIRDPNKKPRHVAISNTLKNLQRTVGGHIEVFPIADDLIIICNEEGKLNGLPYNCAIIGEDFVGAIIFCGVDGEEFDDVPINFQNFKIMFPNLFSQGVSK